MIVVDENSSGLSLSISVPITLGAFLHMVLTSLPSHPTVSSCDYIVAKISLEPVA